MTEEQGPAYGQRGLTYRERQAAMRTPATGGWIVTDALTGESRPMTGSQVSREPVAGMNPRPVAVWLTELREESAPASRTGRLVAASSEPVPVLQIGPVLLLAFPSEADHALSLRDYAHREMRAGGLHYDFAYLLHVTRLLRQLRGERFATDYAPPTSVSGGTLMEE